MNIEQKELINIIREELAEVLGMDASHDRQNLTMKLRDFLDEYTGDDLQAAMDALENVQAMLRYEMNMAAKEDEEVNKDLGLNEAHGLSKKDADYLKGVADKTDDDELKRILKFLHKSNILVDKTKDLSKEKKMDEDFFSDSAEEESAEADEEAAETGVSASYVTGQGSGVKGEGSRSRRYDPRNYVGRDVGRRFTHGSDGKKPPTGLYGKRKYFKIK